MDAVVALLGFVLVLPLFTALVAAEYDRSFWRWFGLACAIWCFAPLVLFVLLRRDLRAAERLAVRLRLVSGGLQSAHGEPVGPGGRRPVRLLPDVGGRR